jgi:hypothetical protein
MLATIDNTELKADAKELGYDLVQEYIEDYCFQCTFSENWYTTIAEMAYSSEGELVHREFEDKLENSISWKLRDQQERLFGAKEYGLT